MHMNKCIILAMYSVSMQTEVSSVRPKGQLLEGEIADLHVSVDVQAVVLGGEHHGAVVHQRDVETLGVLHLKAGEQHSLTQTSSAE